MSIVEEISELIQRGRAKNVRELVATALNSGVTPADILNKAMIPAMGIIGGKFKNNEVYVPEVLIAARAMNMGLEVLRPALLAAGVKPIGKALICTVKGDLHDIGKNLVKMMMEGAGIECVDLGVDIGGDKVVAAIKEHKPQLVCLSALLTTTMVNQQVIIEDIARAGLRENVKIMVGGAPVTEAFAKEIGADAYTPDAAVAAEVAVRLCKDIA